MIKNTSVKSSIALCSLASSYILFYIFSRPSSARGHPVECFWWKCRCMFQLGHVALIVGHSHRVTMARVSRLIFEILERGHSEIAGDMECGVSSLLRPFAWGRVGFALGVGGCDEGSPFAARSSRGQPGSARWRKAARGCCQAGPRAITLGCERRTKASVLPGLAKKTAVALLVFARGGTPRPGGPRPAIFPTREGSSCCFSTRASHAFVEG